MDKKFYLQVNVDGSVKQIAKNKISKVCDDITYVSYETLYHGVVGIYCDDNGRLKGLPENLFASWYIFNHHAVHHPDYEAHMEEFIKSWFCFVGDVVMECESQEILDKLVSASKVLRVPEEAN